MNTGNITRGIATIFQMTENDRKERKLLLKRVYEARDRVMMKKQGVRE